MRAGLVSALSFGSCVGLGWALGCGGKVGDSPDLTVIEPDPNAGQGGMLVVAGSPNMPVAGEAVAGSGGLISDFSDPGCPEPMPATVVEECDPLAQVSECPLGEGCYPFVEHPFGKGCSAQRFGTTCRPAGTGTQGDRCGSGDGRCAPGFVCVVGAGAGSRCARLCRIDEADDCPGGLICGDTDLEGWGVCA